MLKCFGSTICASLFVVAGACLSGQAIADETHSVYILAAGATSPSIELPIANSPVMVSCTQNAVNNVGVGQATITRSTTDLLLDWIGMDYHTGAITRGFSRLAGTHIIWCDFSGVVDIEVLDAAHIQVHNAAITQQEGLIMFVY